MAKGGRSSIRNAPKAFPGTPSERRDIDYEIWSCDICGADMRCRPGFDDKHVTYMEHEVCANCRTRNKNWRNVIIQMVYLEKVAIMDCMKPIAWDDMHGEVWAPPLWWDGDIDFDRCDDRQVCSMSCKCLTCTARMILRRTAVKVPDVVPVYHPSSGHDRLVKGYREGESAEAWAARMNSQR